MMHQNQIVTVFGGSGFVGRQIVRECARAGYTVRVATRSPQSCYNLRPEGVVGQVVPVAYDPGRPDMIGSLVAGSFAVVNCVGILYERGKSKFHAAHVELARQLATACKRYGVERFVHISALGAEAGKSNYARSKWVGEQTIHDVLPHATILRPSVIFGPEDQFFNRFARMAQFLPFLPLIGGGRTRLQPVYVGDVADAVIASIHPSHDIVDPRGRVYELGGPEVLDFRALYAKMFAVTGVRRPLVPLSWGLSFLQARMMQIFFPWLLTTDQVRTLKTDSVVSAGALTLPDLGVTPTSLEVMLPTYLTCYRPGDQPQEVARA